MRPLHALALSALALGLGYAGRGVLGGLPVEPTGGPPLAADALEGVWWTALESQSAAVFHLGPVLNTPMGELRRWTLVVHLPGSSEMLSNVPGLVACDEALPVGFAGELFSVELAPAAGETWGSVAAPSQLVGTVHGLY